MKAAAACLLLAGCATTRQPRTVVAALESEIKALDQQLRGAALRAAACPDPAATEALIRQLVQLFPAESGIQVGTERGVARLHAQAPALFEAGRVSLAGQMQLDLIASVLLDQPGYTLSIRVDAPPPEPLAAPAGASSAPTPTAGASSAPAPTAGARPRRDAPKQEPPSPIAAALTPPSVDTTQAAFDQARRVADALIGRFAVPPSRVTLGVRTVEAPGGAYVDLLFLPPAPAPDAHP
jgi:hypothetical protein